MKQLRELQALAATFTSASDKKAVIAKAQNIVDKMDTFKQYGYHSQRNVLI